MNAVLSEKPKNLFWESKNIQIKRYKIYLKWPPCATIHLAKPSGHCAIAIRILSKGRLYIYRKNDCEIQKTKSIYSGIFHVTFFTFCARVGIHAKTQRISWFIFSPLIKHKIRMKCESIHIVRVSYFVVCFAKYMRNTKSVQPAKRIFAASRSMLRLRNSKLGWC